MTRRAQPDRDLQAPPASAGLALIVGVDRLPAALKAPRKVRPFMRKRAPEPLLFPLGSGHTEIG